MSLSLIKYPVSSGGGGSDTLLINGDFTSVEGNGNIGTPFQVNVTDLDLQAVTDFGNVTSNPIFVQDAIISDITSGEGVSRLLFGINAGLNPIVEPFAYSSTIVGDFAATEANLEQMTVFGGYAGAGNMGVGTVGIGTFSGANNIGNRCIFIGNNQGVPVLSDGDDNIFIGYNSVNSNAASNVIAIGSEGLNNTGTNITIIGSFASASNSIANAIGIGREITFSQANSFAFKPFNRQASFLLSSLSSDRSYTLPDVNGSLMINPFSGANQMVYSTGVSTTATVTVGTDGQFLSVVAGVPAFVDTVGDNIYNVDGTLAGAREVDMAGFNLQFINAGLFRIQTGPTFIYDFNLGVDFMSSDTSFSSNIISNASDGITLSHVDIATPANNVYLNIKNGTIEFINPISNQTFFKVADYDAVPGFPAPLVLISGSTGEVCWGGHGIPLFTGSFLSQTGEVVSVMNGLIQSVTA